MSSNASTEQEDGQLPGVATDAVLQASAPIPEGVDRVRGYVEAQLSQAKVGGF